MKANDNGESRWVVEGKKEESPGQMVTSNMRHAEVIFSGRHTDNRKACIWNTVDAWNTQGNMFEMLFWG